MLHIFNYLYFYAGNKKVSTFLGTCFEHLEYDCKLCDKPGGLKRIRGYVQITESLKIFKKIVQ